MNISPLAIQYDFDVSRCSRMLDIIKTYIHHKCIPGHYSFIFGIHMKDCVTFLDDCITFNELWESARDFMFTYFPDFEWNQIYIHVNFSSKKHKDVHVKGKVLVIAFGEYEGGELVIEGTPFNTKHKLTFFDGHSLEHWNTDILNGLKVSFCCITDGRCPIYNE